MIKKARPTAPRSPNQLATLQTAGDSDVHADGVAVRRAGRPRFV